MASERNRLDREETQRRRMFELHQEATRLYEDNEMLEMKIVTDKIPFEFRFAVGASVVTGSIAYWITKLFICCDWLLRHVWH